MLLICSRAMTLAFWRGWTRHKSSGLVQLSYVKLGWASHWYAQPDTISCPAEWRDG
jgi:hypothetical protein